MFKSITEDLVKEICDSKIFQIRKDAKNALKSVKIEKAAQIKKFKRIIGKINLSNNAFVPLEDVDLLAEPHSLPDGVYLGMLKHPVTKEAFSPAILPFAVSNATAFCIDAIKGVQLMQMIALRILLSVPVDLVRCRFVDLYSYGGSTKYFNRLSKKITDGAVIDDKLKLSDFIIELENIVCRLNRHELSTHETLKDYNADVTQISIPYYFVFISQIHEKIDIDTLSRLYSLCLGKNAANCGIYIFYTVDKSAVNSNNLPLNDLLNISTLIYEDADGVRFSNSIYGAEFENRYVIELEDTILQNSDQIIDEINKRVDNIKPQIVSFDEILENMIKQGSYWKSCTTESISIPIGKTSEHDYVNFILAGETADYFAMIGGRPGYGKTVLLHDIICYGAIKYSPRELEFYLIDCTNGPSFKPYEYLPHARVVATTNQREYTDSVIEYLIKEIQIRADLFKSASDKTGVQIEKIETYRNITGEIMSRILIIVDEFQVLLEKKDRLSNKIKNAFEKIIKEGRKYGIGIVFCTQSYRTIDFDTELITLRIAFNLKEVDSIKVLGAGNDAAAHLTQKGTAILNNKGGAKENNIIFQAAFTEKVLYYVDFCAKEWDKLDVVKPQRHVFDGEMISNLGANIQFINSLTEDNSDLNRIVVFLGVPLFLREMIHSFVTFRTAIGSNLLICGTDIKSALISIALINYQIALSINDEDISKSLFIVDCFSKDSNESFYLQKISEALHVKYLKKNELDNIIEQVSTVLKIRIENDKAGIKRENTPIFVTVAYIQNVQDIRKDAYNRLALSVTKIQQILRDGPDYGIHLVLYAYNYKSLIDIMDEGYVSLFGNQLILHGGALGYKLVEESNALAEGTALLITEDRSTTYDYDPLMLYNMCICDSFQEDTDVLDIIFSICDKNNGK